MVYPSASFLLDLCLQRFCDHNVRKHLHAPLRKIIQSYVWKGLRNETIDNAVRKWFSDDMERKMKVSMRYGHISCWDVGKVTEMSALFIDRYTFNENINMWNVSNVTSMHAMFSHAHSFNQPLHSWNVTMVTDMSFMFNDAKSFNQPINSWNVSKVKDMSYMFTQADAFNTPLNDWDVSNVTDIEGMFQYAKSFNQSLDNWIELDIKIRVYQTRSKTHYKLNK